MQDKLYEVILTPTQVDVIHGSLIAQERLYRNITAAVKAEDAAILNWMESEGISGSVLDTIYNNVVQMLMQFDHFVLGTELPAEFDKKHTLIFKEAFEPFSEH